MWYRHIVMGVWFFICMCVGIYIKIIYHFSSEKSNTKNKINVFFHFTIAQLYGIIIR